MMIGMVMDSIKITKCTPGLEGQKVLLVKAQDAVLTALDQVGASKGDRVLLLTGDVALHCAMGTPTDAAIIAILDKEVTD